jgi:ribonuclease E
MIQKSISAIVNCEVTIDEEQLIATFPSKMYAEVVYKSRNNTPYTIEWVAEPVKNTVGSSQSPAQEDSEMAKDTKDSKDSKDSEEPQKEEAKEEPKTEPKETSQPKEEAKRPEQAESKADPSAEQPEAKPLEQAEPKAEPSAGQPVPGDADAKAQGVAVGEAEEKALYGDLS